MLQLRPNCECCNRDLPPAFCRSPDLLVRVHVREALRDRGAWRSLPKLHGRTCGSPASLGHQADQVPGVGRACLQTGGLQCVAAGTRVNAPKKLRPLGKRQSADIGRSRIDRRCVFHGYWQRGFHTWLAARMRSHIPTSTRAVPPTIHGVNGSPRISAPIASVDSGPTMPTCAVIVAPIR